MKIDFHTHGKLAKKLPFSPVYTEWLLNQAKNSGLDAICMTEHFNTLGFEKIYEFIADTYEKDGDSFLANGIRVFPGMETDIAEGGHVLTVGPIDAILELNQRLETNKEKGNFLPFAQLMELFSQYPVLIGAGHPFREGGHIPEQQKELLERLNFLDLNGKDLAAHMEKTKEKIYGLGQELGIPVVAGSDTHQAFQYGCVAADFRAECNTIKQLKEEMDKREYEIHIADEISFQVMTATVLKRALKKIHALGGDYVSILTEEC